MSRYDVAWHFTVEDASNPDEAARQAYDAFARPGSIAHVFEVTSYPAADKALTETVDIDRGADADIDGEPVVYPASAAERARLTSQL